MTTPDNRPCVKPVVGGVYLKRNGYLTMYPLKPAEDDHTKGTLDIIFHAIPSLINRYRS